mmetsp:Transcript_17319/g.25815  ORF Transcript_17319/g.25815 Transcript_17319/m.25815 type:complete len:102 (+) Transcript_17319:1869-2174(+)
MISFLCAYTLFLSFSNAIVACFSSSRIFSSIYLIHFNTTQGNKILTHEDIQIKFVLRFSFKITKNNNNKKKNTNTTNSDNNNISHNNKKKNTNDNTNNNNK